MQMTNGDSQEASEVEAVSLKGQGCMFHPAMFSPHSKFDGKHSKFDRVFYPTVRSKKLSAFSLQYEIFERAIL